MQQLVQLESQRTAKFCNNAKDRGIGDNGITAPMMQLISARIAYDHQYMQSITSSLEKWPTETYWNGDRSNVTTVHIQKDHAIEYSITIMPSEMLVT